MEYFIVMIETSRRWDSLLSIGFLRPDGIVSDKIKLWKNTSPVYNWDINEVKKVLEIFMNDKGLKLIENFQDTILTLSDSEDDDLIIKVKIIGAEV